MNLDPNKKYFFAISDIHSFASQMIESLKLAGFDKKNKNHTLIVCGDIFDRGHETLKVYKYLKSIPKSRCILIKGNHESLYLELLEKDFPDNYDFSNGTVRTFCEIAGIDENALTSYYWMLKLGAWDPNKDIEAIWNEIDSRKEAVWDNIQHIVKNHEITKWLKSSRWIDYLELNDYIFVHSFIPVKNIDELPHYCVENRSQTEFLNWRIAATSDDWEDARWGCPWRQYKAGLFNNEIKNNRILVCGHWHTSDFHKVFENDVSNNFNIYYGKNLIALDACTALSRDVNVLIIDQAQKCYDKYGNRLIIK